MRNNTNKGSFKAIKWLKVSAWIVGFSLMLFTGHYFFSDWLKNKAELMVAQQSDGVYKLELHGLVASPFIGHLTVDSLTLRPDYKKWEELYSKGQKVSRTLLELRSGQIKMSRFNFFKALLNQDVQLDGLEVYQPKLLLSAMRPDTTTTHKPLHKTVKGLHGLQIGRIAIQEANLHYRDGARSDTVFTLDQFRLIVDDLRLDSASFNNKSRAYYTKSIDLRAKGAELNIPDNFYKVTTDSVIVNTAGKLLKSSKVKFEPTLSPQELAKAKSRAVSSIKIEVTTIALSGINFPRHSLTNALEVQHILIQSPSLSAFKDKKNFPEKGTQPLPHDLAQSIKSSFRIDTVSVNNGYCRYEELADKASETGQIYFTALNGTITNLTNIPDRISRRKPAVMVAQARLMGKAKLKVNVAVPLLDKNGYHTLSASLAGGNPEVLNPILVPTNFVKVEKGYIQSISLNAMLNRETATGSMKALYSNLEVELLSTGANSGNDQGFGKKIISKAANKLLIKSSNPANKGEQPRVAEFKVRRKKYRSVITYWKDCLVSGLLVSIGLEKMAEAKF